MHDFSAMPNYGAFLFLSAVAGLAISAAVQSYREGRRLKKRLNSAALEQAIDRHQHYIDLERSNISIAPDGEVYARCAFYGCLHTVAVNPNLAAAWSGMQPARSVTR